MSGSVTGSGMAEQFTRYARQVVLPEIGVNGQQLLRDSSVLIIGVGGLGSIASLYLAGAGVGELTLADRDRVDLSNLQRQLLYAEPQLGQDKTRAARERLQSQNSDLNIRIHEGRLSPERLADLVGRVDLVLDCSDNFPTRYAVNAACVASRKPLVSGAAIRFEGQLLVVDPRSADAPCYACIFPDHGAEAERCEDAGVLGPVVGVIGSLQALSAIKLLTGLNDDVGILRIWDAKTMNWRNLRAQRDPDCRHCGG